MTALHEATSVGLNIGRFSELLQGFAAEVSMAKQKAVTDGEAALARRFQRVLTVYADSATLWRDKIENARYDFLQGQIEVGIEKLGGSHEMVWSPEIRRIVDEYKLPISEGRIAYTGARFVTAPEASIQVLWAVADSRIPAATKPYLAATAPAAAAAQGRAPAYIEELKALASLRDQGVITKEEFEAKKRQILGLDKPVSKKPPS